MTRFALVVTLAAAGVWAAPEARACRSCVVNHFRSLDLMVYESPLIFVGERVESPDPEEKSEVTIRVLRVLKGAITGSRLQVVRGPLRSGSIGQVLAPIGLAEKRVFILPVHPREGRVELVWCGSTLPLRDLERVESRIHRGEGIRREYVAWIAHREPEVLEAARAFAARVRVASRSWPEFEPYVHDASEGYDNETPFGFGDEWGQRASKRFEAARRKLEAVLGAESVATLRLVSAFDLSEEPWLRHPLWVRALRRHEPARQPEAVVREEAHVRHVLRDLAGEDVDDYVEARLSAPVSLLEFPFVEPFQARGRNPGERTTDFIFRHRVLDRGGMYATYFRYYEPMAQLDPARLEAVIPAMLGSDDGAVQSVARDAIREIPGTAFVGAVLHRMVAGGEVGYDRGWRTLRHRSEAGETARRMTAFLDLVAKRDRRVRSRLWLTLAIEGCFEPVVVERAIGILELRVTREEPDLASLLVYLDAAIRARGGTPPGTGLQEDYRRWFREHPEK